MHATTEQKFLASMPCTTSVQTLVYKQSKNKKMAEPCTGGSGCISAREGLFTSPCYVKVQERFKDTALRHISWLWQLPNLWISSQNWQLWGGEDLRILHYMYYSTKMWVWHNVSSLTLNLLLHLLSLPTGWALTTLVYCCDLDMCLRDLGQSWKCDVSSTNTKHSMMKTTAAIHWEECTALCWMYINTLLCCFSSVLILAIYSERKTVGNDGLNVTLK